MSSLFKAFLTFTKPVLRLTTVLAALLAPPHPTVSAVSALLAITKTLVHPTNVEVSVLSFA